MARAALLLACAALLALGLGLPPGAVPAAHATSGYAQAEVIVHGHAIRVDVADTEAKQTLGLGGRRHLAPDRGMLFPYADHGRRAFWMKDMFIPIDMIWLDNDTVVHIEHDVPPPAPGTDDSALPIYQPETPANFVLELAAGRSRSLGLRVGDQVAFRFDVH
ncbi:MAG TPA: DUF192 domain-containing protein [bacterium]|nr:DUF192 domain-containing protein [bacterium]